MLKTLAKSTLDKLGYRVSRNTAPAAQPYGLEPFLTLLLRLGFAPRHILDVGANHGQWTRATVRFFPRARYTLVEPQEHLRVHIEDLLARGHDIAWISAGAGDQAGSLPFTIAHRDDSSSFVPTPAQAQASGCRQVSVPLLTLNEIVARSGAPVPEMVKIDAEGYDLQVIGGASDLLGKTDVFLIEAAICCPDYPNTLLRAAECMAAAGYRLIDITDLNRSPRHGVLWLCEAAFLRDGCPLFDGAASYE